MEYFFESSDTIEKGHGFSQFDGLHIGWLIFLVLATVGCCFLYRRLAARGRRVMRYVFAVLERLNEICRGANGSISRSDVQKTDNRKRRNEHDRRND